MILQKICFQTSKGLCHGVVCPRNKIEKLSGTEYWDKEFDSPYSNCEYSSTVNGENVVILDKKSHDILSSLFQYADIYIHNAFFLKIELGDSHYGDPEYKYVLTS